MLKNSICNRCYENVEYKNVLLKNKEYVCFICKDNIFYNTILNIQHNTNNIKEIILNKKNNNKDCAFKKCGNRIEEFEKYKIIICCKCVLKYDNLNKNNYSVVKPDIMCMKCNYSLCSEYNFHKRCYNQFNIDQ